MKNDMLLSRRKPGNYIPKNGGFETDSPRQSYNRALYGALRPDGRHRFRLLAGDLPRALLYLPGCGGRLFWGMRAEKKVRFLSGFEKISSRYDGGKMSYRIADGKFENLRVEITMLPLAGETGAAFHIAVEGLPAGYRFVTFFGGAGGPKSDRNMDPGYCAAEDAPYAFHAEYCKGNRFACQKRQFELRADTIVPGAVTGKFSFDGKCCVADAHWLEQGIFSADASDSVDDPVFAYESQDNFDGFLILRHVFPGGRHQEPPATLYGRAEGYNVRLTAAVKVDTPDALVNSSVRAACAATEGIWNEPVYTHGAWSWNVPLMGWRSMYGPCVFGCHDRIRTEAGLFNALQLDKDRKPCDPAAAMEYSKGLFKVKAVDYSDKALERFEREKTEKGNQPVPDPEFSLARQSPESVFISEGFIPYTPAMPWHAQYNMQEVFFDELIYEYDWTGDDGFAKKVLPHLQAHLKWQKRCFDGDDDGLYESFADFWASDGIFYSGAGCALASAYTYRANLAVSEWLGKTGGGPEPFRREAEKIRKAFHEQLWLAKEGHPAECRDAYGERLVHPSVSLPTVVHCAESGILDDFELCQTIAFIRNNLERLPVDGGGELIWNTNWVPYVWSVRDIDYADVLHLSLTCFKAGEREEGYRFLKGALRESACHGVSPGAFQCVYEGKSVDFADTVSMFDRTLVEGLFGIRPRMGDGTLLISPEFPDGWEKASIHTKDFSCSYSRTENAERITAESAKSCSMVIRLPARYGGIASVTVDGQAAGFTAVTGIGRPLVEVKTCPGTRHVIEIVGGGQKIVRPRYSEIAVKGTEFEIVPGTGHALKIRDPQQVTSGFEAKGGNIAVRLTEDSGFHTFFLLIGDGDFTYWMPVSIDMREKLAVSGARLDLQNREVSFALENNQNVVYEGRFSCAGGGRKDSIQPGALSETIRLPLPAGRKIFPGNNRFNIPLSGKETLLVNAAVWEKTGADIRFSMVGLDGRYNGNAADLFRQSYRSPRSSHCSLQVPEHLFPSDWCVTSARPISDMNDDILRKSVSGDGVFLTDAGIPFLQVRNPDAYNAVLVSRWDNYPDSVTVPVDRSGRKLYILLTGYTNQMQCYVPNAAIRTVFEDGHEAALNLVSPYNFASIEKGPETQRPCDKWCYRKTSVHRVRIGSTARDGGEKAAGLYAQILDLNITGGKVKELRVEAVANDAVVGLLGITAAE